MGNFIETFFAVITMPCVLIGIVIGILGQCLLASAYRAYCKRRKSQLIEIRDDIMAFPILLKRARSTSEELILQHSTLTDILTRAEQHFHQARRDVRKERLFFAKMHYSAAMKHLLSFHNMCAFLRATPEKD